jgi:membrane protease YdiL (CAAX protease family)
MTNPQAPPGDGPRERGGFAVMGELVFFGASFVVATGLLQLVLLTGVLPDPSKAAWVGPVAGPAVTGIAALVYTWLEKRGDRAFAEPLADPRPGLSVAWTTVGSHILLALGGSVVLALLMQALGVPPQEQAKVREIVAGGVSVELILLGVAALALAPTLEEWLFRHLLFRRLWHAGQPAWAYALSAALFAVIHFNPSGFPTYVWLGLVFAHAYRRTGRLWCASLVHFGNNAATLALLLAGVGAP